MINDSPLFPVKTIILVVIAKIITSIVVAKAPTTNSNACGPEFRVHHFVFAFEWHFNVH